MAIETNCPTCGNVRFVSDHRAGSDVVCSKCGVTFRPKPVKSDDAAPTIRLQPYYPDFDRDLPSHLGPVTTLDETSLFGPEGLAQVRAGIGHYELRQFALICLVIWIQLGGFLVDLLPRDDRTMIRYVLNVAAFALFIGLLYLGVRGAELCRRGAAAWTAIRGGGRSLLWFEVPFGVACLVVFWLVFFGFADGRSSITLWLAAVPIPMYFAAHVASVIFVGAVARDVETMPRLARRARTVKNQVQVQSVGFTMAALIAFIVFVGGIFAMSVRPWDRQLNVTMGCSLVIMEVFFGIFAVHAIVTFHLTRNLIREA